MDFAPPSGWLPWLLSALVTGAAQVLLGALLWRSARRRRRAEGMASQARADLLPLAQALRHAFEAVIVTDAARRITWVNEAFVQITGFTAAEALGRTPGELLQFDGTDPDTILRMRAALDAGQPFTGEVLNLGKRPEPYWLDLYIEPMRDEHGVLSGFVAIESDITERKRQEERLRYSEALFRGALETVDEAFALFDPQDRLVFCNDKYLRLFPGLREVIVPGVSFERTVSAGAAAGLFAAAVGREEEWIAQRMAAHRSADHMLVQQLSDGRVLRVIDRRMPDGHTVVFRVDITELVRATEAAERADQGKTQFIATVSHELRTPLQVIMGFSDLGRHFAAGHVQYEPMFEDIHAAGQRMLRLVNELLDFTKFGGEVGQLALKRQPLAPLLQAVADELGTLAARRGVTIRCTAAEGLVGAVDAFRLQQVLRNVLANAVRFAPDGDEIELLGTDLGLGGIDITVRDHGPGIPADELESIFEAFVQSSRTRDGAGGTGLGLAISRRLMGAHGGRISASAPEDGGALIHLWLPPAPPPAEERDPARPRLLRSSARPPPAPPAGDTPAHREEPCPTPS